MRALDPVILDPLQTFVVIPASDLCEPINEEEKKKMLGDVCSHLDHTSTETTTQGRGCHSDPCPLRSDYLLGKLRGVVPKR